MSVIVSNATRKRLLDESDARVYLDLPQVALDHCEYCEAVQWRDWDTCDILGGCTCARP